jgi:hypothetical protein
MAPGRSGRAAINPLLVLGRRIRRARDRGEFASFCSSVPIHSRKAYDLIAIANAVDAGLLPPGIVEQIGWSKARLVAERGRTIRYARGAVAFARTNTLAALVAYFQRDGVGTALITKSFHLTKAQAKELDATLLQAGARMHGGRMTGRNDSLMRILRSYRQSTKTNPSG